MCSSDLTIRWHPPPSPFLKLNMDGSALGNPRLAGVGGVLRDHWSRWISSFSLHVGLATNNLAELAAVRRGLEMAWDKGTKHLQLELDFKVVLTWLTNPCVNYPTNMLPLICDCKNLLTLEWEVHVQHVYREVNGCTDALAKRGTRQRSDLRDCFAFLKSYCTKKIKNKYQSNISTHVHR